MALTEINSKSIKDGEILNADVNASAAIVGSKLADDSIAEVKLDISNTPSDGKFLKYKDDTDKLTWDDVPAGVGGATGVTFNDSVVASWGAGADLKIKHDGTNSYIIDEGTGGLFIRGSSQLLLQSDAGEHYFIGTADGSAELYHNDVKKLETSATGVTVTGTVAATAVTGDGSGLTGIDAGATGGGTNKIFWENEKIIDYNYTITNNHNAMTAGPVEIAATGNGDGSAVVVTVGDGETWTIV